MWPEEMKQLAKRERPAGLPIAPAQQYAEIGHPNISAITMARVRPLIEKHGGKFMMEDYLLYSPRKLHYGAVDWIIAPMDMQREYDVPQEVYHRIQAIDAAGVVFHHWIWGEEVFAQPQFRLQRSRSVQEDLDPIIIGIVITDRDQGIGQWYCLGKWLH